MTTPRQKVSRSRHHGVAMRLSVALWALVTPAAAQENQGDRPMWDIAPAWSCHFLQEFRCSSDEKNCAISPPQEYHRDLSLDFGREAISFMGGGTFPITKRQHLPPLRKSFFVQDQTEFFFQGGMLWRTFLPSFAGTQFQLQAYRCSPE